MALYHLLDPIWSRFPWPDRVKIETSAMGPVQRVRLVRCYAGRETMAVFCYILGDTLVDTGFPAAQGAVLDVAASAGVKQVLLTHHHEDHAGNVGALVDRGLDVSGGALTARLLASELPIPFYQHLVWGRAQPAVIRVHDEQSVALGRYQAQVLSAPGHSVDQVVYYIPEEGWLFAGDVFIHQRVKIFRRDEDFAASLESLRRLVALDFDVLFCGHRPCATGGRSALERKLAWLEELDSNVKGLAQEGLDDQEIVRRLGLERSAGFRRLSMGDASAQNMVASILRGPVPRSEVRAALGTR